MIMSSKESRNKNFKAVSKVGTGGSSKLKAGFGVCSAYLLTLQGSAPLRGQGQSRK